MTKGNYTQDEVSVLTNRIVEIYNTDKVYYVWTCKQDETLKEFILSKTQFLSSDARFSERIYCIIHDITTRPTCPVCGKPVGFLSPANGYKKHCSCKCSNSDPETKSKIKETCLENWGVESSNQSEIVKEKKRQTFRQKFGVDNPFQNEYVREKYRQTSIKTYHTEHPT